MNEEYTPKWLAAQLGLKYVATEIDRAMESLGRQETTASEMIVDLFTAEYERRKAESQKKRIKTAGFYNLKYLDEIDRNELPEGMKNILPELETLDFIRQHRNIVLYGNPGTGKHTLQQHWV